MAPESEGSEDHAGLSWGLAPHTVPVDAMKCIIILRCCLGVAWMCFFLLTEFLLFPEGCMCVCVCDLCKIHTRILYTSTGSRHLQKPESGQLWWILMRSHQSGSYFYPLQLNLGKSKAKERVKVSGGMLSCRVQSLKRQYESTECLTIQGCVCEASTSYPVHFKEFQAYQESFLFPPSGVEHLARNICCFILG